MPKQENKITIVSGLFRSKKIFAPVDNKSIRPTKERIRDAIFNSLFDIKNKIFLEENLKKLFKSLYKTKRSVCWSIKYTST